MANMSRRRMLESGLAALVSSVGAGSALAAGPMDAGRLRNRPVDARPADAMPKPPKRPLAVGHIPVPAGFADNAALKLDIPAAPEITQLLSRISYGSFRKNCKPPRPVVMKHGLNTSSTTRTSMLRISMTF